MLVAEPPIDADDVPVPEGDVVTAPVPSGPTVTLRFASPFEPWLSLNGRRVTVDDSDDARAVLLWMSRRLSALMRALDTSRGLRGVLTPSSEKQPAGHGGHGSHGGHGHGHGGGVVVTDVIRLEDGSAADHGSLGGVLEGARVRMLPFAVLGPSMSKSELLLRVRTLYAAGTPLEVRIEDHERVIGRRRLRVGRA